MFATALFCPPLAQPGDAAIQAAENRCGPHASRSLAQLHSGMVSQFLKLFVPYVEGLTKIVKSRGVSSRRAAVVHAVAGLLFLAAWDRRSTAVEERWQQTSRVGRSAATYFISVFFLFKLALPSMRVVPEYAAGRSGSSLEASQPAISPTTCSFSPSRFDLGGRNWYQLVIAALCGAAVRSCCLDGACHSLKHDGIVPVLTYFLWPCRCRCHRLCFHKWRLTYFR